MDPASAAVAFIGFSAAIVQLAGSLANGCMTLYKLKQKLNETPQDISRLHKSMKRLERLVAEVRSLENDIGEHWLSSNLGIHWSEHAADIENDLNALNQRLSKLVRILEAKSITSKHVRATIRKAFMEEDIVKFERILTAHQDTFSFMLSVVAEKRSRRILSEIQCQTKRIDELSTKASLFENAIIVQTRSMRSAGQDLEPLLCSTFHNKLKYLQQSSPEENQVKEMLSEQVAKRRKLRLVPLELDTGQSSMEQVQLGQQNESLCTGSLPRAPQPPASIAKSSAIIRFVVTCTIFSRQFPIGTLTGREITKRRLKSHEPDDDESDWHLSATLFPLPWLTNRVIKVTVGYSSVDGFSFGHKWLRYNHDPQLIECMNAGDLLGLQRMFADGKASVHDLVAPWSNSLLHEAVVRHATGIPNMLEICQFLLVNGTDPNLQNANGRTALIQCCQLMKKSITLSNSLIPLASCMIERGADLSVSDSEGYSACSLVFESPHGFRYIDEYVYRHIDLDTYEDLRTTDFWLMSALARCMPSFRRRLEGQLKDFRTPQIISSSVRPCQNTLTELSVEEQVKWIKAASQKDRTVFMRIICAYGPLSMVQPFLTCGLDLDEAPSEDSLSYIRAAGRRGNLQIVQALSDAGASIDQKDIAGREHQLASSVVDDLIIRWQRMKAGHPPEATEKTSPVSEYRILSSLLFNPTFKGPNVLLTALHFPSDLEVVSKLLESGCGRRDGQPPASWHLHFVGSEVIEAVKLESPYLEQMLGSGLGLECEDRLGCTATLHALDMGSARSLDLLIKHGANLTRTTKYGISALNFAESNLHASHPRPMQRAWINKLEWQNRYFRQVSLEADQEAYEMVRQAISGGQRRILPLLIHRGHFSVATSKDDATKKELRQQESRLVLMGAIVTGAVFILVYVWNGIRTGFKRLRTLSKARSRI
ncbi:hypothetical protein F5Y19DRAFT_493585 [Xylariaceae sp. FL1651]|nr:hypothetical protein F5Y19DRAFT_493585 [Xylariaceae sp. FL1651]